MGAFSFLLQGRLLTCDQHDCSTQPHHSDNVSDPQGIHCEASNGGGHCYRHMVEPWWLGPLHLMHQAEAWVIRGELIQEGGASLQQQYVTSLQYRCGSTREALG